MLQDLYNTIVNAVPNTVDLYDCAIQIDEWPNGVIIVVDEPNMYGWCDLDISIVKDGATVFEKRYRTCNPVHHIKAACRLARMYGLSQ